MFAARRGEGAYLPFIIVRIGERNHIISPVFSPPQHFFAPPPPAAGKKGGPPPGRPPF
ncbi:hypothetical protein HMPREF0262_02756 [Clostridium sp. ATCC 29733]|nr:hypothetical protein HMPREF0262_02756 [Clostridium sp. ATCC 29733]